VWPFVVRLTSRRTLAAIAIAVLVLETPFRMYLHRIDSSMGFFHTLTRLDPIAVGALVALHPRWFRYAWAVAPAAIWLLYSGDFDFVYLALALTFGGVVACAVSSRNRWLRSAPVRFIGKISYGIYIFHPIAYAIFWRTPLYWGVSHWPHSDLFRMATQMLFVVPFAAVSWYSFERPVLGLKKYFENGRERHEAPAVDQLPATVAISN